MPTDPRTSHTLIVRLWPEPREMGGREGESEWRGEIRHVPSGAQAYFRGLDGLAATIRDIIENGGERVTQAPPAGG